MYNQHQCDGSGHYADLDFTELGLREIFTILRKHTKLLIGLPLIATTIAAIVVLYFVQPTYEAETTLIVAQETIEASAMYNQIRTNRELVKTYRQIARSRTVLQTVIDRLQLDITPEKLRNKVEVSLLGDTEIIQVAVQDTDPVLAQWIAEHTADVFMIRVQELMNIDNVTEVDPAVVPVNPIKPSKTLTVAIAGVLGVMTALGLAFFFEFLDNTVKSVVDIENTLRLPVLGTIPNHNEESN